MHESNHYKRKKLIISYLMDGFSTYISDKKICDKNEEKNNESQSGTLTMHVGCSSKEDEATNL